jgi:hypothetical protein
LIGRHSQNPDKTILEVDQNAEHSGLQAALRGHDGQRVPAVLLGQAARAQGPAEVGPGHRLHSPPGVNIIKLVSSISDVATK